MDRMPGPRVRESGEIMSQLDRRIARASLAAATVALMLGVGATAKARSNESIGITALVVKQVEGLTEDQVRQLVLQDSVFANEVVQTGMASASELKFADETRISVGPNSRVVLDEFVYDPDPGEGAFALRVTTGVFRFVSGNMASSSYKIETPTVTVGMRGTALALVTRSDGAVAVILESGDGVEVAGATGQAVLLETPGKATVAFADGNLTEPGPPPAWAIWRIREMDSLLAGNGTPNAPSPDPDPRQNEGTDGGEAVAKAPPPPEEEPTAERRRGLPRALQNHDLGDLPKGLQQAALGDDETPPKASHRATDPGPVPVGGKGNDAGAAGDDEDDGGAANDLAPAGSPEQSPSRTDGVEPERDDRGGRSNHGNTGGDRGGNGGGKGGGKGRD